MDALAETIIWRGTKYEVPDAHTLEMWSLTPSVRRRTARRSNTITPTAGYACSDWSSNRATESRRRGSPRFNLTTLR